MPRPPRLVRRTPVRLAVLAPVLAVAAALLVSGCDGVAGESREHNSATQANGQVGSMLVRGATLTLGLIPGRAVLGVAFYQEGARGDRLVGVSGPQGATFTLPAATVTSTANSPSTVVSASAGDSSTSSTTGDAAPTSLVVPPMTGVYINQGVDQIDVEGLPGSPLVGDSIAVTFSFAGAGSVTLQVPVVATVVPGSPVPTPTVTDAGVANGDSDPAVPSATASAP